jgi:hypothetical protein
MASAWDCFHGDYPHKRYSKSDNFPDGSGSLPTPFSVGSGKGIPQVAVIHSYIVMALTSFFNKSKRKSTT